MDSSFYSNSQHIDFDSVLAMDDQGSCWAPKPKAASKKRKVVAAVGAPVIKKKRTMRNKSSSSKYNLEIVAVAQEAVPIQMVESITVAPAVEDLSDQPAGKTDGEEKVAAEVDASADRDQTAVEVGDASADRDQTAVEVCEASADKYFSLVDDPDTVINQVLHQLDSISDDKDDKQSDRAETWFDRAFDEMLRNDSPVVTPSDTDEEAETVDVGTAGRDQQVQFLEEEPVVMEMNDELLDTDEKMSLEDILLTIPADVSLPSAGMEITKINMGKEIKIPEVNERTWFLNSLPKIPADNKGKAILNNFVPGKGSSVVDLKVIDMLSDLHLLVLEALREQALAHGLKWTKTCCSKIIEGRPRDHGAIIARTNTNTKSTCWLRTMIRVDGVWAVEPFCDQWVKIPRPVVCTEVSKQRSFVDLFPTVSKPLRILRKIWADICLEIVEFCASRRLLPVGSLTFSSSDESMNFDDSTSTPLPAAPIPDITIALNQLRASIEQLRERDDGGAKNKDTLLLHLHNFKKQVIACLDAQDRVLGTLHRDSHDQRNLLSLELQYSHKKLGTQILTTGLDVADVRRVVRESHQELNARTNSMDEQVAATRHELLDFSAQAQQTLNIITSQLSELVAYINQGGDNKKGESSSSRRPLPTPVHQSEGTGDGVRLTEPTQADIDNANRAILERIRNEDSLHAERERDRARRERRLSRSGAYKRRRGY
ncbi:hypothetical protein F511_41289 [Dorcoceras hygrometricum]|uniref:Uncharacterized protein n=1 Tax=Dorcoceras hygrometricum TaxID=472368 RepID=A0A2Z7CR08_9LAMI|nr:hypothetical protein F511_41289 [Dorcoceras hygrometricum]